MLGPIGLERWVRVDSGMCVNEDRGSSGKGKGSRQVQLCCSLAIQRGRLRMDSDCTYVWINVERLPRVFVVDFGIAVEGARTVAHGVGRCATSTKTAPLRCDTERIVSLAHEKGCEDGGLQRGIAGFLWSFTINNRVS